MQRGPQPGEPTLGISLDMTACIGGLLHLVIGRYILPFAMVFAFFAWFAFRLAHAGFTMIFVILIQILAAIIAIVRVSRPLIARAYRAVV